MTLDSLGAMPHVTGVKQVTKAVRRGNAVCVFLASDADFRVIRPLREECEAAGVEFSESATMTEIGAAASIEVGASAAAVLRNPC